MTDWYDYENKKAITFPPVGSEVIAYTREVSGDFRPKDYQVKVIAIDGNVVIYKFDGEYYSNGFDAFKPLDWERDVRKDKLIDKAVQIMYDNACATKGELINGVKRLYDLGYLKFPEEK